MRKGLLVAALCGILAGGPVTAMVPGIPYATEWTQLLVYAQMVQQLAQQVQMLKMQIQQFGQMTIQGKLLSGMQFYNMGQVMVQLSKNIQRGLGLSYTMSNLDTAFRSAYPGYLQQGVSFGAQYRGWNTVSLDTISGIMSSIGAHAADLNNDATIMNLLQTKAQSVSGETQAIQAGTQIAAFQSQQIDKLRQIMVLQLQTTAQAEARQAQTNAAANQVQANAFSPATYKATN